MVYSSTTPGVHHACGHDGHMAALLAVVKATVAMAPYMRGCVKFIFQARTTRDVLGNAVNVPCAQASR